MNDWVLVEPRWLAAAWRELGLVNDGSAAMQARLSALYADAGAPGTVSGTPWCAAFVGACLRRTGFVSTGSLLARSYEHWGQLVPENRIGAIAVLSRGSDASEGHVSFVVGWAGDSVYLLGGNQQHAVTVERFDRSRVVALRWAEFEIVTDDKAATPPVPSQPMTNPRPANAPPASPVDIFDIALAHVLEMEGGWTDDPADPGGPTNFGLTLADLAAAEGRSLDAGSAGVLKDQLAHISAQTVRGIYQVRYWQAARCSELPSALAFMHFDTAVNQGVSVAARLLQEAVGAGVDGTIGPETLGKAHAASLPATLEAVAEARRRRYRALPTIARFGHGWLKRVDTTLARALALVPKAAPAVAEASPPQQQKGKSMTDQTQAAPAAASAPAGDPNAKWWGQSMTIWGTAITALATVLPVIGPAIGFNVSGDTVRQVGQQTVETGQAIAGLFGTLLAIYGRARATQPLGLRTITLKL
jgi:uncharacterized protein (TIGR02594 family)